MNSDHWEGAEVFDALHCVVIEFNRLCKLEHKLKVVRAIDNFHEADFANRTVFSAKSCSEHTKVMFEVLSAEEGCWRHESDW